MKKEFYFQDDKSNKFWTIELIGNEYLITNGRVGAKPRETRKVFLGAEEARRQYDKQIKSKLNEGYKEGIPPRYAKPDWSSLKMSEDVFWRIIGLFNWKKTGDDHAVVEPAVSALSQMSEKDIILFEEILATKLFALDTKEHARQIGTLGFEDDWYFSNDGFLYARCCVIANGRGFYELVGRNPEKMPKDMEFETLLYIARIAFERKTGTEYNHKTEVSWETYSNKAGWPNA